MTGSRRIKALAIAAAVVALVAFNLVSAGQGNNQPAAPLPGRALVPPRVSIESLHGEATAVNFWASWCTPCQQEAPELKRLSGSLPDRTRLVGVNVTDDSRSARSFVSRYGWTFPNLSDADGEVGTRYGVRALPTTVIVGPRGRIAKVLFGPQTQSRLRSELESAR